MNTSYPASADPDKVCREVYRIIASKCRHNGLLDEHIKRSLCELNEIIDNRCYLKEIAYKPTGVALGYPLPDNRATKKLWRMALLTEHYLKSLCPENQRVFAFVPPACYHVTLVNRSHYSTENNIVFMTMKEKQKVESVISSVKKGAVKVHFNGLILTQSGNLLVPGYPCDDYFYEVRSALTSKVVELNENVPQIAHMKIGHVLVPLDIQTLQNLLNWLMNCGEFISFRLSFEDIYTSMGRIRL